MRTGKAGIPQNGLEERPMRVLQINAVYGIGSTGNAVRETQDYLMTKGVQVKTACSISMRHSEDIYIIGNWWGKKLHALGSRISGCQGHFSTISTWRLIRLIKHWRPDIVHMRNIHGNFLHFPLLMSFFAANDIATVLTLDDCWYFTGKCVHYHIDQCQRWKNECGHCPRLKKDNVSFFFDRTTFLLREKKRLYEKIPRLGVIGVSDWIIREAEKSVLASATKLQRIYNWVDFDIFKPSPRKADANSMIILAVAMDWQKEKGLYDILEVSRHLSQDEKIILIGEIREKITLPLNVINRKATTNQQELAEYYQKASVLLNLSWMESFGKVSAEALACGTPVICYNTTASPELIGEGCGYVVEPGDIEGVCEKLQIVKKNGNRYKQNCVDFAHRNFSKDANLRAMLAFYQDLSEHPRPVGRIDT